MMTTLRRREGSVAAAPSVKIAVVTLSEIGNANIGVEVVKMAAVMARWILRP